MGRSTASCTDRNRSLAVVALLLSRARQQPVLDRSLTVVALFQRCILPASSRISLLLTEIGEYFYNWSVPVHGPRRA